MKRFLPILFLIIMTACSAPVTAPAPVLEPAPAGLTVKELVASVWSASPQLLRLRQTAKFSFRGREVPMVGMMELDTRSNEARLVAINQMGVKLFDLGVSADGVKEHYLLPQLERYPRFGEAVAASLRRIFLSPQPQPEGDELSRTGGAYHLSREREGRRISFLFGGQPVRMVEKCTLGAKDDWRVVYLDYRWQVDEAPFPREIVLEDRRAGYRLDLRIDNIKQVESGIIDYEQTEK